MSKVFTHEKVRALALKIWATGNNVTLFQEVITEWLDQKPIEPVVVGQIWTGKYSGDFEVIAVNDVQVVRKNKDGGFMINGMEDFLTTFERVHNEQNIYT